MPALLLRRLRLLRLLVLLRRLVLRLRRLRLRRLRLILVSEQPSQKARRVSRLLLRLLLQLFHLRLELLERHVLHQQSLRHDVERIGIRAQLAAEQILGVRVLLLQLCLVDSLSELHQELLFLGSHSVSSGRAFVEQAAPPD